MATYLCKMSSNMEFADVGTDRAENYLSGATSSRRVGLQAALLS